MKPFKIIIEENNFWITININREITNDLLVIVREIIGVSSVRKKPKDRYAFNFHIGKAFDKDVIIADIYSKVKLYYAGAATSNS